MTKLILNHRGPEIGTADEYLKALQTCIDGGPCDLSILGVKSLSDWQRILKEGENRLTWTDKDASIGEFATKGMALSNGSIMDFDAIISTSQKDRDGDILKSGGAELDPACPLLMFHNTEMPIGKLVSKTQHNDKLIAGRFCIFDTALGRDAAILVEGGGVRISHGFDPLHYQELKGGRFEITKYLILETSLVPVPSNPGAIITAFSRNKFHSPFMKSYGKQQFDARQKMVAGVTLERTCHDGCECDTCKSAAAHEHHGEGHGTYRHEGESLQDCVSRKIEIMIREGKTQEQAAGAAYAMCGEHKDKDDPIRWNKSLSKRFDVANEPVEPSSMSYDWAAKYLEVPVKNIFDNGTFVPAARMGSWLTAFRQVTADFNVVDIRNIHGSHESPPIYETIQLKSNLSDSFLIEGTQFFVVNGKSPLIVSIDENWGGVKLRAFCRYSERQMVIDMFEKTWQIAKENNFLKGEAFSLSGEFVPRDNITWSDVFLTEKNQKPLTRMVNNINSKGRNCPNRGIIMMGPPGTGKTLSGRVIKNMAQSTFIWISARDFHRSGAFGGFEYAFELAKELAPCILFFEDIDNWIGRDTVDLMKTEMDGLTKSSGVITILTTNFPENLPEALVDRPGRFHEILKVDLPNEQVRKQMISKWISGISDSHVKAAVDRTKGYSGAHIYELAQFAKAITETDELPIHDALTKALDKIDEQRDMISNNLLQGSRYSPRKDIVMITKVLNEPESAVPSSTVDPSFPYTNTVESYEDEEGNRGQGPQQGDHDWHERHMSSQVVDSLVAGLDTPEFNVGNTPDDQIFAIAQGPMTGPQQNPAPNTMLANSPANAGEPGVPTPTMGVQYPIPMPTVLDVSTSPGPQGGKPVPPLTIPDSRRETVPTPKMLDVNDAQGVQPLDRDSASHHDTEGNIDTTVHTDVATLKCMAGMVAHSGKEGSVYLHPEKGHVHHVADPEDLHPDNAHLYHGHEEIKKLYGSVKGVKGVKVAIKEHPTKGMGYKMVHKSGGTAPGADQPMSEGYTHINPVVKVKPVVKALLSIKGRIEYLFHGKAGALSDAQKRILADGYVKLMAIIKFSSLDPNGNGMGTTLPNENTLNTPSMNNFTGVPQENDLNVSSRTHFEGALPPWDGVPAPNQLNEPSMNHFGMAMQPNTPAANPPKGYTAGEGGQLDNALLEPVPAGRRTDPGTFSNESVDGPNIPGSTAFRGSVLNEGDVMNWLEESEDNPKSHEDEFDKEFEELLEKELFADV